MRRKWTWVVRAVLPGVLVCVLLCLGMGAAKAPMPKVSPDVREIAAGRRVPEQPGLGINHTEVDWSLDDREQMDFLLTPALLVQEAVSDGVILTYPEE